MKIQPKRFSRCDFFRVIEYSKNDGCNGRIVLFLLILFTGNGVDDTITIPDRYQGQPEKPGKG